MVIEELYTRLGFQVDPKGIDKGKKLISGFKTWIGGLALGAGFAYLAKTGLDAAMTMESLNAQFTVMAGSAERASTLLGDISEFAAKTPFSKLGLADAGKTLMAFGMEAEKVIPTLKMLGDVAGADQNRLNSLALVFGQIQSTGKLMGQDLLQLINQGFNPLTELSKKTGMSVSDLKDAMSQGAITADMVTLAFKSATSEGGLFFGNLEAQSQTLAGKISTLKDNFVTALQNMAEAFLPLLKAGTDMLITFDWSPIVAGVQNFAVEIHNFIVAFKDLPVTLREIITWLERLAPLLLIVFGPAIQAHILRYAAAVRSAVMSSSAFATAQTIVQRAALASGAAMNYQVTALGLLKSALFSVKMTGVSAFKALGLAMKSALGPIGLALMAIEGFVEAYNWLERRNKQKATEEMKATGRKFIEQQRAHGKTIEQVMEEQVGQHEARKARVELLQEQSAKGGEEGRRASQELMSLQAKIRQEAAFIHGLEGAYQDMTGLEWRGKSRSFVKAPAITGDTKELEDAFAKLEKEIKENTKATKKNTKAKEKPFDISALSRQAFDAAFNVKLRELTLGTI